MHCSICDGIVGALPYYGTTCSKECARSSRLNDSLAFIEQVLREIMLNVGGSR